MLRGILKIFKKREKNYISEEDKFLYQFDKINLKRSASQISEISKHKNIFNKKPSSVNCITNSEGSNKSKINW